MSSKDDLDTAIPNSRSQILGPNRGPIAPRKVKLRKAYY